MASYVLIQHQGDFVRRSITVTSTPVSIGRAASNDLMIQDDTCSWHHALLWVEQSALWVRDLNSSNGTFHNGTRLGGNSVRLRPGDRLMLGDYIELSIQAGGIGWVAWRRALVVRDIETSVDTVMRSDRFVIGSHANADLRLKGGPAIAAVLMVHGNGEVWYGDVIRLEPLLTDRPFVVAGRTLALAEVDPGTHPVIAYDADRYGLRLVMSHDGMRARFEDPKHPDRTRVIDSSLASVLHPLARALDSATEGTHEERGWCSERELVAELWGDDGHVSDLRTALWYIRASLQQAGVDPWCVEQRDRFCRVRVREVVWVS